MQRLEKPEALKQKHRFIAPDLLIQAILILTGRVFPCLQEEPATGLRKGQCEHVGLRVDGLHYKVERVSLFFLSVFSGKKSFKLEDGNLHVGKTDVLKVGELHTVLCRDNSASLGSYHPYLSLNKEHETNRSLIPNHGEEVLPQ